MNFTEVKDLLPLISTRIRRAPTGLLTRAYVDAARDFCQQSQWLKTTIIGQTEPDVRQYDLGQDDFREIVNISAMAGKQENPVQEWPIVASDSTQWDWNLPPDCPVRYCYIPEAQMALDPVPKKVYGLTVGVIIQPKLGVTKIPTSLVSKWDAEIRAGALATLFSIPNEPWTNPSFSEKYAREYRAGISNAKADAQRQYNTGSVRARPRRFFAG